MYFKGTLPATPPPRQSLILYMRASALKWNHLPVHGGIYDQHPTLLDEWDIIRDEEHKWRERERKKAEAASKAKRKR